MPWSNARPKASTAARGYGKQHERARAAYAARHDPANPCVRCGHALGPMGPWLHLDHNEARTGYLGFSHGAPCPVCGARCNLKAGARKGRAMQAVRTVRVIADRW